MSIAYTSGEPSGIGPDIAVIYAQEERTENLQVYCDPDAVSYTHLTLPTKA